ncbi:hypothetical protein VPH35_073046 [Triticum aestivum]
MSPLSTASCSTWGSVRGRFPWEYGSVEIPFFVVCTYVVGLVCGPGKRSPSFVSVGRHRDFPDPWIRTLDVVLVHRPGNLLFLLRPVRCFWRRVRAQGKGSISRR